MLMEGVKKKSVGPPGMKRQQPIVCALRSKTYDFELAMDKKGCQIHPLGEGPSFQSLTPRTFAKSVAELDALRSRVQELELKLSLNEVEVALLAPKSSTKKLPPLVEATVVGEVNRMIATAPETCLRKGFPLALPLDSSPSKSNTAVQIDSVIMTEPPEAGCTEAVKSADLVAVSTSNPGQSGDTLPNSSKNNSPILLSPPPREQTKITIGHDGDAIFAVSQRNRLYQILKRVTAIVPITEDELVLLKKLVDAEIGDVIKLLLDLENEDSRPVITEKLHFLLANGSPSKYHARIRLQSSPQQPVWGIQYPLQKIARSLEQLRVDDANTNTSPLEVIVLVSSGAYNPIHMLHIRAFYVARQYVEANYKFPVVGAFISPSHDTFVRGKNRRNPREMITKRHRLALIEAAVASSSWIEVDKWEITRRRVMDYLSTLSHVREMCESHFKNVKFHVMYVCGCNTVVKLSHSALREEGFGCITVCRPTQTEMVMKHLGKQLAKATTIVEDTGVLPCELERATSFRVRQALTNTEKNGDVIELMVGKPVFQYLLKHDIGRKIAGKENWNEEDKQWRSVDFAYVEYMES